MKIYLLSSLVIGSIAQAQMSADYRSGFSAGHAEACLAREVHLCEYRGVGGYAAGSVTGPTRAAAILKLDPGLLSELRRANYQISCFKL
jgi:hypothetical protein